MAGSGADAGARVVAQTWRASFPSLIDPGETPMQVNEIMTRGVEVIGPDDTLEAAARKMNDADIGPLPVCENGRLVGMLTDRDITTRATAHGLDPKKAQVNQAMTCEVLYCFEDEDIAKA